MSVRLRQTGPGSASRKRGNHIVPVRYDGQHEQVKAAVGGRPYSGVIEPSPRKGSAGRAMLEDAPSVKVGRRQNPIDQPERCKQSAKPIRRAAGR